MKREISTSNRNQRNTAHRIDTGAGPRSIRLLIVEAQRLFRQSLRVLLERERNIAAVVEATDGREAYRLAMEHKPDIVLLDVDMPDLDVESVTKLVRKHLPNTRVLLLARYDEDSRIVAAMQAGAFGYILKDTDCTDFLRIIKATVSGEHILSPVIPERIVRTVPGAVRQTHEDNNLLLSSLTDREREILACAAAGRGNKEIADQLCVSIDTVKTHLHHIYQKLSVDGRVEAILTYLKTQ
ncbi:MAG TPA: response regulator transcription factor [Nitrospira sp.]|nr:response regulator transcription factor [Nitrospira sp.]